MSVFIFIGFGGVIEFKRESGRSFSVVVIVSTIGTGVVGFGFEGFSGGLVERVEGRICCGSGREDGIRGIRLKGSFGCFVG